MNDNFQIMNMNYKLKKIKKNRKKKIPNYKNIELLDTLSNEPIIAEPAPTKPSPPTVEASNPFANIFTNKTVENFSFFTDADYEGCIDCVKDKGLDSESDDIRPKIIEFINYCYDYFRSFNKNAAETIANKLTKSGDNEREKFLIEKYLGLAEALTFTGIIIYNWFFLMYYRKTDGIDLIPVSRDKVKQLAQDSVNIGPLYDIFLYFFEFSLFFPEMIDKILLDIVPEWTSHYFNATLCFILLFLFLFYVFTNFILAFKNLLIDLLNGNTANRTLSVMLAIVFILFVISTMNFQKELAAQKMKALQRGDLTSMFMPPIQGIVWMVIKNIIRFFIVMLVSVPVGGILTAIYIIFYSLFALPLYKGTRFFGTFIKMREYISETKSKVKRNTCEPGTWEDFFARVLLTFNAIMNAVYECFNWLTYILLLIFAGLEFSSVKDQAASVIGNFKLSEVMMFISIALIVMIFGVIYMTFPGKKYWDFLKTMFVDRKSENKTPDENYNKSMDMDDDKYINEELIKKADELIQVTQSDVSNLEPSAPPMEPGWDDQTPIVEPVIGPPIPVL